MIPAGFESIWACFENAEEIFPVGHPEPRHGGFLPSSQASLPQMPQLPQPKASARRVLTDQEDEFEERAAIIEYDDGLRRPLAEFLAMRGRGH